MTKLNLRAIPFEALMPFALLALSVILAACSGGHDGGGGGGVPGY